MNCCIIALLCRESLVPPASSYLPVSTPPASGDQAVTPRPKCLRPSAAVPAPTVRSIRLYSICKPDERRPAAQLGQGVGLGDHPGRHVRDAGVEDLALPHQVVEGPHHFFDRA